MKRLLMLSAVTRVNRHTAMQEINDLVVSCGGWMEGHTLFSNIAATFRFVVPAGRLRGFVGAVDALGVHIDAAAMQALGERAEAEAAEAEVSGSLSVTFIHDEPDLRREIPAVPG